MDPVHNYARTTIAGRQRYLGYLTCFLKTKGIATCEEVGLEELLAYNTDSSATASVTVSP